MIYNLNKFFYKFSIGLIILTILIWVNPCALEEPAHDLIPWSKSQIFFWLTCNHGKYQCGVGISFLNNSWVRLLQKIKFSKLFRLDYLKIFNF
jgi:hypothetical protein